MTVLLNRLKISKEKFSHDKAAATQFINIGEFKRDPAIDPVEHAAWTVICQLILNLDETLNKE